MNSREILAMNLAAELDRRGISQNRLAQLTRLSQTMINNIMRQEQSPRVEYVEQLARALKVPTWALLAPPGYMLSASDTDELLRLTLSLDREARASLLSVARSLAQCSAAETS